MLPWTVAQTGLYCCRLLHVLLVKLLPALVVLQAKLDGPDCDYEGAMEAKRRISRQIFDAVGHKSLETQAFKVCIHLLTAVHCTPGAPDAVVPRCRTAPGVVLGLRAALSGTPRSQLVNNYGRPAAHMLCLTCACPVLCCALPHSAVLLSTPAQAWFSDNEFWLVPYAAFCFLRDLFGTAEHWKWGTMAKPTPQVRQTHGVQDCTVHA